MWRGLTEGGRLNDELVSWHRADGSRRYALVSVASDAGGGFSVVSFVDVTEEHRTRLEYNSMLQNVDAGFATFDRTGVMLQINPAFARQCGLDAAGLVGSPLPSVFADPGVRAQAQRGIVRVLGDEWSPPTDDRVSFEGATIRPGESIWIVAGMSAVDVEAGIGVVTTHDVTERRRFINRLSRYEQLFRRSNDLIYIIDPGGRVRYASPSNARSSVHNAAIRAGARASLSRLGRGTAGLRRRVC